MTDTIQIKTDARGISTLVLNIPDKHNALSVDMISELTDAARSLGQDAATRAVILTGAGKSFCAGGDLNWMRAQMAADDATRAAAAKSIAMMLFALNTMPKPLIGRIQGNAFGGGVGLACVCDVAFADQASRFGLTETHLGLIPATIGPYVVARMGEAKARRVFMSSRIFSAEEAQELGVVAKIVPADELDLVVEQEAELYLSCAPGAVASAKELARRLGPAIDKAVIADSIDALVSRWQSEEATEGIEAFLKKTSPSWAK